ncbi:energy transducer TonB [Hymenobacter sp. YC55]|uniref:energy transducer TonB n=1 Tax=Hymenobacter sp. YC55 TaxID=3034019 RepID=UPI0023F6EF04|nr:energy transducer TonB [Hymenobacter sp. YC55]MDF7814296.1 energy transducer TonB [Hymenobacter sp. YC55]
MLPLPILNVRLNACHEDWQQMTPVAQGHHCSICDRVVLDFTKSTQADLESAFQASADGRVCGRFRQSQLAPTLQLRPKLRRFLVALVLVCGLGLTSNEAWAQVRKATQMANCPNEIELILKTPRELNPITLIKHIKHESVMATPILPELTWINDSEISGGFMGAVIGNEVASHREPQVYSHTEKMPDYKFGGLKALPDFINRNWDWPKEAADVDGRIFINFIIDKNGRMRNAHVIKGIHPLLDAEALRVIKLLNGQFTPGRHNNQPVNVNYILPITIKLS